MVVTGILVVVAVGLVAAVIVLAGDVASSNTSSSGNSVAATSNSKTWAETSDPLQTANKNLVFAVKHSNKAVLESKFQEVSDPASANYSKYLTQTELDTLTRNKAGTDATVAFLKSHGITPSHVSALGHYVTASATIQKWEEVLAVKFKRYLHHTGKKAWNGAQSMSMPEPLVPHLDAILNLVDKPIYTGNHGSSSRKGNPCNSTQLEVMQGAISHMSSNCQAAINKTSNSGGRLENAELCPCLAEVPTSFFTSNPLSGLQCLATPGSTATVSTTYKSCKRQGYMKASRRGGRQLFGGGGGGGGYGSPPPAPHGGGYGEHGAPPPPAPHGGGYSGPPWSEHPGYVTPDHLNKYYGVTDNYAGSNVHQGIYESAQYVTTEGLKDFQSEFSLPADTFTPACLAQQQGRRLLDDGYGEQQPEGYGGRSHYGGSSCVQGLISGTCPSRHGNSCMEANLDAQYIAAMAQQAQNTVYEWSAFMEMGTWCSEAEDQTSPPDVISMSYGENENAWQQSQVNAFNMEAMKLGAKGISLMIASGDGGAAGRMPAGEKQDCGYHSSFPASSPYVTSVGATMGLNKGPKATEIACQCVKGAFITSQGGFSVLNTPAPSWQTDAISAYFQNVTTQPEPGYGNGGRGTPDVSASGHSFRISVDGQFITVDGTSAATPVFSGIITLINARRKHAGLPTLGFLNPVLYKNPQMFTDVTSGFNGAGEINKYTGGCDRSSCTTGFYASKGWDPLTGLGTPIYSKMLAVLCPGCSAILRPN
jgi:subtilase family serine protease